MGLSTPACGSMSPCVPVCPCVLPGSACEYVLRIRVCLPLCACACACTGMRGGPWFPAGPTGSLLINGRQVRICLQGAECSCILSPEGSGAKTALGLGGVWAEGRSRSHQWGKFSRKTSSPDLERLSQGLLGAELGLGARTQSQIRHCLCPWSQPGASVCTWTQAGLLRQAVRGLGKQEKACPSPPGESRKSSCRRSLSQECRAVWWEGRGKGGREPVPGGPGGLRKMGAKGGSHLPGLGDWRTEVP